MPFMWSLDEWTRLTTNLKNLLLPEVVDHLNELLPESLRDMEADADSSHFMHVFLSRYVSQDRPLTGYFVVCCVMEIIWTVLAQALSPPSEQDASRTFALIAEETEAAAANEVWDRLMCAPINVPEDEDRHVATKEKLIMVSGYAIRCFADLLEQIQSMDAEPSLDTYAWETMSESLVRMLL